MKESKLVYLCCPYTFNAELSFKIANEVAADLMSQGYVVFSPVSQSHPIADYLDPELRYDQKFWMAQDLPMVAKCDELVAVLIGEHGDRLLKESKGCTTEIIFADDNDIPIKYYTYDLKINKGEIYG